MNVYSGVLYRPAGQILMCYAAVLAACAKSNDRAAEEATTRDTAATAPVAAVPAAPAPSGTISLVDVAGRWKMRSTDESGGNAVDVELVATTDSHWTIVGQGRKPIPERVVAVAGDSIVTEAGPYESFIRKGIQVRTHDVLRLQGGKLVSRFEARYALKGGDSVAQRRSEGTRVP